VKDNPIWLEIKQVWPQLNGQVHPVILQYPDEDYPYHGVGTAFILEHNEQLFVVSAQHVLDSQKAKSDDFTILIRDASYSLIFNLEAVFRPEYEPHFDILIRRVAPFQRELLIKQGVYWVSTEFTIAPQYYQDAKIFYVFGYSEDHREYDYSEKRISASLSYLVGTLASPNLEEMVSLNLVDGYPNSLRGFSGSPVIAVIEDQWMFAGMLTLAVKSTGVMHFIPAHRIVGYLLELDEMVLSNSGNLSDTLKSEPTPGE
jgi:hypothetical protein